MKWLVSRAMSSVNCEVLLDVVRAMLFTDSRSSERMQGGVDSRNEAAGTVYREEPPSDPFRSAMSCVKQKIPSNGTHGR